jgi:hypothetical protein
MILRLFLDQYLYSEQFVQDWADARAMRPSILVFTYDSLVILGQFRYVSCKGGSQNMIQVGL